MITCPFCASEVKTIGVNEYSCAFCRIELGPRSPFGVALKNGERPQQERVSTDILIDSSNVRYYADLPLSQLMEMHTFDLLMLLKAIRKERTDSFDLLRTFNKALKTSDVKDVEEFSEAAIEQGGEYEYWTRKAWTIENILVKRMGYFPDKITENMLMRVKVQSDLVRTKNMRISKTQRKKVSL